MPQRRRRATSSPRASPPQLGVAGGLALETHPHGGDTDAHELFGAVGPQGVHRGEGEEVEVAVALLAEIRQASSPRLVHQEILVEHLELVQARALVEIVHHPEQLVAVLHQRQVAAPELVGAGAEVAARGAAKPRAHQHLAAGLDGQREHGVAVDQRGMLDGLAAALVQQLTHEADAVALADMVAVGVGLGGGGAVASQDQLGSGCVAAHKCGGALQVGHQLEGVGDAHVIVVAAAQLARQLPAARPVQHSHRPPQVGGDVLQAVGVAGARGTQGALVDAELALHDVHAHARALTRPAHRAAHRAEQQAPHQAACGSRRRRRRDARLGMASATVAGWRG